MRKASSKIVSTVLCSAIVFSSAGGVFPVLAKDAGNEGAGITSDSGAAAADAGGIIFIDMNTGNAIDADSVYLSAGYEMDGGFFTFPSLYAGDSVDYRISVEGYEEAEGSVTLGEDYTEVYVDLREESSDGQGDEDTQGGTPLRESMELTVGYGDASFDLSHEVPDEFSGAEYTLVSGDDVLSLLEDGTALIKNAGSAVIEAWSGDDLLTISVTVEKCMIGDISYADVDWDDLSMVEDGTNTMLISGTVSESAGIRAGDTIGVSATARMDSAGPGTHKSTLEDAAFYGDENYVIGLGEDGPEITVTASENFSEGQVPETEEETEKEEDKQETGEPEEEAPETSVEVSFDDGQAPMNGMYFSSDREMTVRFTAGDFDEAKTEFDVSVNGTDFRGTISDIRNGKADGIELVSENAADKDSAEYTILFGRKEEAAETEYSVSVSYDGTEASYEGSAAQKFVIDEIAPEFSIIYRNGDDIEVKAGSSLDDTYSETSQMGVSLVAKDGFFDSRGAYADVVSTDAQGNAVSAYPQGELDAVGSGEWAEENGAYRFDMAPFNKEANYEFSAGFEDLAGNRAPELPHGFFTIDRTSPEGEVTVTKSDGTSMPYSRILEEKELGEGTISGIFDLFDDQYVTLDSNFSDSMSGVASAQYALIDASEAGKGSFDLSADMSSVDWQDWTGTVKVDTDKVAVILEKITDRAGHTTYLSSEGAFIVDTKEPSAPVITIDSGEKDIYSGDIIVKISASDQDNGGEGVYSGIKDLSWEIKDSAGNITQSGNIKSEEAHAKEAGGTITILAEKNRSNTVLLTVRAADYAGNTSESGKTFAIDDGEPKASFDIDMTGVSNGKYFNSTRKATIVFSERNFDPDKAAISLTAGGSEVSYTMKALEEGAGKEAGIRLNSHEDSQASLDFASYTDERTNTYEILFGVDDDADIDYGSIKVTADDGAGNSITYVPQMDEFTIDKVAPVITAAYKENGADITKELSSDKEAPRYGNDAVTVSVSIDERNFSSKDVKFSILAEDAEGKAIENAYPEKNIEEALKDWLSSGTDNTKELPAFDADANFGIGIDYTDMAGNKAVSYERRYFTIDRSAPEGTVTVRGGKEDAGYTDYKKEISFVSASGDAFAVSQKASDSVSGIAKTEFFIDTPSEGARGTFAAITEEELAKAKWAEWETELKDGKLVPKEIGLQPDSQSVVYVKLTDKAGNTAYINTDGFIADHTAPETSVRMPQTDDVFSSSDIKAEVSADDVLSGGTYSGISRIDVRVTSGGRVTQERTFEGADVSERLKSVRGAVTISAQDNNSNDVTVYAEAYDAAGNKSEDSSSVMVDITAPEISTSMDTGDVRHTRYFNTSKVMTVTFRERNFDPSKAVMRFVADGRGNTLSMRELYDGAASRYGISVAGHYDSEAGTSVRDLTDSRENTYRIVFGDRDGEDTDYSSISFEIEDRAGNKASHTPEMDAFTVDKVAPAITVGYRTSKADVTGMVTTNEDVPYYSQDGILADITVNERNFFGNGVRAEVTAKDHYGNDTGAYGEEKLSQITSGWRAAGSENGKTMPAFSEDSNYGLSISCEDLAGNAAEVYPFHYFTVDSTPPEGAITVDSSDGSETYTDYSETSVFRFISRFPIRVVREALDRTSGIASIQFCRYIPEVNASGRFSTMSLGAFRDADWTSWNDDYYVEPDSQAVICAKITDRAGNILYINTEGAMISESTPPALPEISINAAEPAEGIYAGDVPVSVHVEDQISGGTYAGLRNVTVQVLNSGNVTQEDTYTPGEKRDRVRSYDAEITVDAQKNNSNYVTVRVTVEDWAGNISSAEREMKIDVTEPRIEVSYDRNDPANGKYYNTQRVATVTVYERNFNPSRVNFSITGAGNVKISGWSIGDGAGTSDDNPNVCTITYDEDSDYTFTMDLTDKAGNAASYGQTDSFTIDTTMPEISVSFDNNDGRGKYFNAPRTATIRVDEMNFDAEKFTAGIQASLEGRGITPPPIDGWTHEGSSHYASIVFDDDGDYSFVLNVSDLAENPAQQYVSDDFTIDLTYPEVEITGIEDGSANRKEAAAVIKFSDINFDRDGVVVRLEGYRHEAKDVTGTFEEAANGGTVTLKDFERVITEDDVYTLTAYITDLAGNTTEKKITFSVNRFGSNYYYSDETKAYLEKYYQNAPEDIVIYEVNVNTLKSEGVTVYRSGETVDLKDGQYRVDDMSEDNDWKKYRYTVDASVAEDEGIYEILVRSVDEAGNRQDNKIKDAPVTFVIDRTAPSAVITGAEDGEIYDGKTRDIVVQVSDNFAIGGAEVFIDGKSAGTYSAEQIAELGGKIPVEIRESSSWQTVSAKATDAAGNTGSAQDVTILVSTSSITRALNSGALRKGAIGAVAAAGIGTGIFFLLGKRKKEDDEEEDGE